MGDHLRAGSCRQPPEEGRRLPRFSISRGRELTAYESAVERLAASPAGAWTFLHVLTRADRLVLARTRGRASLTPGAPVGLIETVGTRSGRIRRTPLLYATDGPALLLVASNGGRAIHPAWLHNLRAEPRVRFLSREHGWQLYRAREATADERERRWAAVTDLYAGYDAYARRAGDRQIAIVILEPARD